MYFNRNKSSSTTSDNEKLPSPPSYSAATSSINRSSIGIFRHDSPRFERTTDGEVEYTLAFDVHSFSPDNVLVSVTNRVVTVQAKLNSQIPQNSSVLKQFRHDVRLPDDVDIRRIRSVYRKDGQLVIRAPIIISPSSTSSNSQPLNIQTQLGGSSPLSPRSRMISVTKPICFEFPEEQLNELSQRELQTASAFSHSPHLVDDIQGHFFGPLSYPNIHKRSANEMASPSASSTDSVFGVPLRTSSASPISLDKYVEHLAISPEFHPSDINVSVRDKVVYINAHYEDTNCFQEHKNNHILPDNVDGRKLTAKLGKGVLVLEAPFLAP